jgi:large subunit ribosomal protein L10
MNKEQKAAVIKEVAAQIETSEALFAIDYRGISVPQAAELRERLSEVGARFRVVKNTLTIRSAEEAGVEDLKELLEGPTAFTFVAADGDVALAAKALNQFRRANQLLEFKGGRMGEETLTVDQIVALAQLPARNVLDSQLVGVLASPVTGVVRLLNQLIAGIAQQLQQVADQGLVSGEAPAAAEPEPTAPQPEPAAESEPPGDEPPAQEAEQDAEADAAESEAAESAGDEPGDEETSSEDASPTEDTTDTPSEGEETEKEG